MKNLIKAVIVCITILVFANSLMAQNTATTTGIYLTEQDYEAGKLNYILGANDKLRLNTFLNGKKVAITRDGKKIKLQKNEIYGYRENGHDYRFYNTGAYRIVDTAGFMLYSRRQLVEKGKGSLPIEVYYYSAQKGAPVMPLTLANLNSSFAAQTNFRYALRNYYSGDAGLAKYDAALKMYVIKYLFLQQRQQLAVKAV